MSKFFLIRHGETQHNVEEGVTGQTDIPLNRNGKSQAEKLADRLEKEDFDLAYSSDLERTYETTRIVAERQGLEIKSFREFREMDFGVFEGKHKSEFRKAVDNSDVDNHFFTPEGGESSYEAGERFLNKLEEIKDLHENQKILVGGHSVVMKSVLMNILALTGEYYRKLNLGNTSITELKYDQDLGWTIIRVNDTAHLE